jgi:hypothetical protein
VESHQAEYIGENKMETTRREEQINELAVGPDTPKVIVEDGTYEAELTNFKVGNEVTQYGPKQFVKFIFKITKGQYTNINVTYKGNKFLDQASGQWGIGPRSKLAEAIKTITNGLSTINRGHIGTRVFVKVKTHTSQASGERYPLVETIIAMPRDYSAAAQPAAPAAAPVARPQPQVQASRPAPQAQAPAAKPAAQNPDLMDDLKELSDYTLQ